MNNLNVFVNYFLSFLMASNMISPIFQPMMRPTITKINAPIVMTLLLFWSNNTQHQKSTYRSKCVYITINIYRLMEKNKQKNRREKRGINPPSQNCCIRTELRIFQEDFFLKKILPIVAESVGRKYYQCNENRWIYLLSLWGLQH